MFDESLTFLIFMIYGFGFIQTRFWVVKKRANKSVGDRDKNVDVI